MITKNFEFFKAQKIPAEMEKRINAFLADHLFKFASQCESPSTRKVGLTILAEPAGEKVKATVKAKVFRSTSFDELEAKTNEFLATDVKMRLYTQTFIENNITTIIFYE